MNYKVLFNFMNGIQGHFELDLSFFFFFIELRFISNYGLLSCPPKPKVQVDTSGVCGEQTFLFISMA